MNLKRNVDKMVVINIVHVIILPEEQ